VRTNILDADRNWPEDLGEKPADSPTFAIFRRHTERAIAEGRTPASVADAVFDAISADRFWVIPHQDFLDIAVDRWHRIAERVDPEPPEQIPGMPPFSQLIEELTAAMGLDPAPIAREH
jgi:hypothetical protein